MFHGAILFNGDISNWDVSSVSEMAGMFMKATSFNCDISKWDVSTVVAMDDMFVSAVSFKQKLCGTDWVRSEASKTDMFAGSSGTIARTACTATAVF